MALTKVSRSLLNTGVADSSDATAISIDSSENVTLASDLLLADSKKIKLGGGNDLEIYHDGTHSYVSDTAQGNLILQGSNLRLAETDNTLYAFFTSGAGGEFYYDGSRRFYTHTSGVKLDEHLYLVDSKKIFLGTGDDLSIYHDGSNSYIEDSGTGDLYLSAADNFIVRKYGGSEVMIKGTADGAAELYYDDSKKLETVTGGVTVTGALTANGGVVVDNITIDGTEIALSSGDLTLDVAGDISLDADGGDVLFKDGGTEVGRFLLDDNNHFKIKSIQSDADILFQGNDGGSGITALRLDMSSAGAATFNDKIIATELDISGNVDIDGTLETDNLTVGGAQGSDGQVLTSTGSGVGWESVSAGPTHKTFGTGSIMIGDSTTGTINAANNNTGLGVDIFEDLTSGDENTAIGGSAMKEMTTGSYNTAVGYVALKNQVGGDRNTAIGREACRDQTSGDSNTGVGTEALKLNVSGVENVAVGSYCLNNNTGSNNTAVGTEAMKLTTSGTQNAAFGKAAMITNETGNYNTALGPYALKLNVSGSNNTAIGYEALNNYTGGDNTAIGYRAGKAADQSRNTYIGYDAGTAQNGSADNMAIGYMALSRQTTGANGNIAIGNYTGRAVVSSASTSQLVAIGHSVASNASAALAGYQNCFVGYNIASASGLAGAFRNTALGANALTDLTTGDNNTTLGNMAGNSITTATNNLCLGYQAGESGSPSGTLTTGSNTIVLGDDNIGALYCTQSSINTSDRRDKADITNFTAGLDFIKKMQPVTYKWDRRSWYLPKDEEGNITDEDITKVTPDGSKKENVTHIGFIAQDVETLEKEIGFASDNTNRLLTNLTEDGNRYGMKYERLVTVLVNAVKDLSTKLDAAETRIKTLEDA